MYDDILQAIEESREMQAIKEKAIADGTFMKAPNGKPTKLNERQWLQVRTKAFKRWFGDLEKIAKLAASFFNNTNTLTINRNEYTDEFRRIQEESRSLLPEEISSYHQGRLRGRSGDPFKRNLGRIYGRLLSRRTSSSLGSWSLNGKDNQFKIRRVNGSLFHDIFEINRNYLENGELVDLHDDYSTCKCYLSDDGLCGFAIDPDGKLVSVFSLNSSFENRGTNMGSVDEGVESRLTQEKLIQDSIDESVPKFFEKNIVWDLVRASYFSPAFLHLSIKSISIILNHLLFMNSSLDIFLNSSNSSSVIRTSK